MSKSRQMAAVLLSFLVFSLFSFSVASAAPQFANAQFKSVWEYSDKRVDEIPGAGRGYTWGPNSFGIHTEDYIEGLNGKRQVEYFDKSRMELSADGKLVTNGLLTKELVTGAKQDGNAKFTQLTPSTVQVAGDNNSGSGNAIAPTYASFKNVVTFNPGENTAPNQVGQNVKQAINKAGEVKTLDTLPSAVSIKTYEPTLGHNIPQVFWDFQNLTGLIWNGTDYINNKIYTDNPTANVFGYAISEPHWARAVVAGTEKDVLIQLYERRVLTYTPTNPPEFRVEMGNIGQHYYQWRYGQSQPIPTPTPITPPAGASVSVKVQVPASMRTGPFTTDRFLNVPPNFSISVYTRISAARFTAIAPNGDLLVSQPSTGKVLLVRPNPAGGDPLVSSFVSGLRRPHDIVFHTIGATTWVYISETNQINRYMYVNGDQTAHDRQVVVANLPDSSSPELGGSYGHELKNIALGPDHKLYVSIGSTCNACTSDTVSNPVRGSIYQYEADGSNGRLFARGLRNAEGLAFIPDTNVLWAAVNNRDNIAYPYNDNTGNYGKVITSYVDNHPVEEFTQVRDSGNYGWPFCNPNSESPNGLNNMPFDNDYQYNKTGAALNCASADRINKGIQAHSAPLGLTFLQNTSFAAPYRNGAVIGLHGSWNRSVNTGAKVIYFPWNGDTQTPGNQIDLVTGWIDGNGNYWGRPVDMAVDLQGNMFISDDSSGTVYKLTYIGGN